MAYVGMGNVTGGKLYCRKKPQAGYDYWGRFDDKASIPIYSCSTSGWYETRWPANGSNVGYVMSEYVTMGGSSGGGDTIPGVSGSGPNSKVSAAMIRAGNGLWKKDTSTTHPQIKTMQGYLNQAAALWGTDVGQLVVDGVYGENTRYMVSWYQARFSLGDDGIVGKITLGRLESSYGTIS